MEILLIKNGDTLTKNKNEIFSRKIIKYGDTFRGLNLGLFLTLVI